ncbi:N-glycosylase/DNA lyase [Solea senegalensis]|uniref:N-glycosylase/DNA lyase n=1 Tax=Solea senegalensis TaxID=28829 RepID=A0AAV6SU54_SOLSE|nr:N-glycosylase/DNA lyase [Solea senegalensis]KAG7520577.1 N-glycosylase/DNA lyase [Solea senegalensis]
MAKHAVFSSGTRLWKSVDCVKSQLRLELTLACGQSFRWRETSEGHWTGVIGGRVWTLTQTDDTLWYHVYKNKVEQTKGCDRKRRAGTSSLEENKSEKKFKGRVKEEEDEQVAVTPVKEEEQMLRDYFQLNVNLEELHTHWGKADPHLKQIADIFTGVRMLRQDPTECLFSFICTSNNHISRIQGMVERLCQALGSPLCQVDQTTYYDFPSLTALADSSVEARLRDLGFGYRARFLQQSAKQILETHGPQWLKGLRSVPYPQARHALRTLPGVGTKVADCVCLMSLDKAEAVPVDTHVWQIAKRDYKFASGSTQKTITDKLHRDIGEFFRNLWGPYAGWAQSVLFCADLKKFQKMKETLCLVQPKKEEEDEEEEVRTTCKKTKMKTEGKETVKHGKTKSACCKKATKCVKNERVL